MSIPSDSCSPQSAIAILPPQLLHPTQLPYYEVPILPKDSYFPDQCFSSLPVYNPQGQLSTYDEAFFNMYTPMSAAVPPAPELPVLILSHSGRKSCRCLLCGRTFPKLSVFKNHYVSHTGEKPHQCPRCKKQFSLKCNLRRHERTVEHFN